MGNIKKKKKGRGKKRKEIRSHYSSSQNFPEMPSFTQKEANDLTGVSGGHSALMIPPASSPPVLPLAHCPQACSSRAWRLLPQGLCTGCSLCLKCSSLHPHLRLPPPHFRCLLNGHLLSQSFSDPLFKIAASLIAALPADSPIFFSSITIFTPLYFPVLSIYVAYWAIYNYHHISSLRAETVFSPEYSST